MNKLRALALGLTLFVTCGSVRAGEGVLMPGGDKAPPPPPPVSAPDTTIATVGETAADSDENALMMYAAAIWLQLRGISIQL